MLELSNWLLLVLVFFLLVVILLERRSKKRLGKILTRKLSDQIEQIILKINKDLAPLYQDLKLLPSDLNLKHPENQDAISELRSVDNRLWNNQLALLKSTILRQHQLHQYLRQMAQRKEEELRAFNYTISHDLKTPVNNALYFMDLSLLRISDHPDPELTNFIDQTKSLLLEIRDMIDSIAAYAYADNVALSIQAVDLSGLLRKITRQLKQSNYHYNQTEVIIADSIPPIAADPLLIRQALTNILSNAFKFTKYKQNPRIEISGFPIGEMVELHIQDNGAGIPLEGKNKIFELFQSAHSRTAYEGSGAGLAIVKRIIERHNGVVWLESEGADKGAVFIFKIPAKKEIEAQ